jgi:hypothetical protein
MKWRTILSILFAFSLLQTVHAGAAGTPVIVCIQCHSVQPNPLGQPVKLWQSSIHAEHGITCNACHGGDPMDSAQAMSPSRGFRGVPIPTAIPALCGGCHMGVAGYYMKSAHGLTLGKGGPTCVTCHGSHSITSASLDIISKKNCTPCHSFEKARMIKSAMLNTDQMLKTIEKRIKILKNQGVETDNLEKRLFSLRNRFHVMFHSLDVKLIIQESDHIQAELEKTSEVGGAGIGPIAGAFAVGWALLLALFFYLIKINLD